MCKCVFNDLKKQFMIILILAHFDSDLEYVFKADLSNHAQKDVLLQYNKDDVLCSIVFFSQKLNVIKSNNIINCSNNFHHVQNMMYFSLLSHIQIQLKMTMISSFMKYHVFENQFNIF